MRLLRVVLGVVASASLGVACGTGAAGNESERVSLRGFAAATETGVTARYSTTQTPDDMDQGGLPIEQSGVFDFEQLNGTIRDGGGEVPDAFAVGGVVYLPIGDLGPIDHDDPCYGREFGKFDYPQYEQEGLGVEADFVAPVPFDPGQVVASLARSDATLTEIGSEDARGVATTHYRVDVDGGRLDARFTDGMFDDRELVAFDVWVDRERRLRRAQWVVQIRWGEVEHRDELDLPDDVSLPIDNTGTYRVTTTVELWDYGVPVHVQTPPADEVCDFVDLFGRTLATFDDP